MATIATTFQTYQAKGNREDLSDLIDRISPTDVPFYSSLKKKKATAVKFEWQSDSLAAAANNAQIEGDDIATFTAVTPTTRWDNYTQIARKEFIISRTQEVVDKAGRSSEIALQKSKKGLELKRDVEVSIIQNQTYNAGAAATARQTRGLEGWLATNCSVGAGLGAAPVPSTNTAPVAGTARAYSETLVKAVMQQCWTQGGSPTMLMVTPADKVLTSAFSGNATRYQDTDENMLNATFDVYVTDFGKLKIVPNRFARTTADVSVAFLLDFDHLAFRNLDPLKASPLAKTGDAEKYLMTWEYGLEVGNEAASGQIRDLTT
jgi:hypothetical protein